MQRWVEIPRNFLNILSCKDSIILSTIINIICAYKREYDLRDEDDEWDDDWNEIQEELDWDDEYFFPCTTKTIQNELPFNAIVIQRSIKRLKSLKFIKTKRKGIPAKRWIFVDGILLEKTIIESMKSNEPQN